MKRIRGTRYQLEDPAYLQRNPYQVFLLGLSVLASFPLLQGHASSGVLERELDDRTVAAWGLLLLVGSVVALVGEFMPGYTWLGLVLERTGLAVVGSAAAIYTGVVLVSVSDRTGVAYLTAIQAAYALSCAWRVGQITRRMRWVRRAIEDFNRHADYDSAPDRPAP